MATILVLGAALGGLQTALLLAEDGHDVTVLERDVDPAPADAESAWSRWRRPGIPQLRLTHLPLARWLQLTEAHLAGLVGQLTAAGAVRMNVLAPEPGLRSSLRAGDERFDTLAARPSLLESVATRAAEAAGILPAYGRRVALRGPGQAGRRSEPVRPPPRAADGTELGIPVVAVDPAYTSHWGAQHWQRPLTGKTRKTSRHDAAAAAVGGVRARPAR